MNTHKDLMNSEKIYVYIIEAKELIKEYVTDHFNIFGFYPYDVEVDGIILSYSNYWSILEDDS